jgi:hypothetical protein
MLLARPDALLYESTRQNGCRHSCVKICSVVFNIAPVSFPHSCLSLEAETWRRTASFALSATGKLLRLTTCTCISVINQWICVTEIKNILSWFLSEEHRNMSNVWTFRVFNCVTDPDNYGCYTGHYWSSTMYNISQYTNHSELIVQRKLCLLCCHIHPVLSCGLPTKL